MQKLRKEKEEINELIAQGEVEKADELKKDIAWKKAFDKTDGKKVNSIQISSESHWSSIISRKITEHFMWFCNSGEFELLQFCLIFIRNRSKIMPAYCIKHSTAKK